MPNDLEIWALSRAEQIVLKEGMNLVHAGQWMDKQLTARSACRLRNEILRAIMDAFDQHDRLTGLTNEHHPLSQSPTQLHHSSPA